MQDPNLKTIGFIAQRTGASVSALRFYSDEELLPTVRSPSGHRLFHRSTIRRVAFILIAQGLGYRLDDIKNALGSLPDSRTPTVDDWAALGRFFSADIDHKIEQLQRLKQNLDGCIGCGCLSLEKCALYNPEDRVAAQGPGPNLFNSPRV